MSVTRDLGPRELRRQMVTLRKMRSGETVWLQGNDECETWYPVDFWGVTDDGVEVRDPLTLCPPKPMTVRVRDVRLDNPDKSVRIRREPGNGRVLRRRRRRPHRADR